MASDPVEIHTKGGLHTWSYLSDQSWHCLAPRSHCPQLSMQMGHLTASPSAPPSNVGSGILLFPHFCRLETSLAQFILLCDHNLLSSSLSAQLPRLSTSKYPVHPSNVLLNHHLSLSHPSGAGACGSSHHCFQPTF